MKNFIVSLLVGSACVFGESIIIPKQSDINLCQQDMRKDKEKVVQKIDATFLTKWFESAFSTSIDRRTVEYLKNESTLYRVESALMNFEIISSGDNCRNFAINLKYSYTKALENIDKVAKNNLGDVLNISSSDKFIISSSSADVYNSVLSERKVIYTLANGTHLRMTDRFKPNVFEEWGEFVYEDGNATKGVGWINMANVVQQ